MGELRERRRLATPVLAAHRRHGRAGADLPRVQRRRRPAARGWGIAMGTDTAFAARRARPRRPDGARRASGSFLLTLVIVDDIVALTVIALAYTDDRLVRGAARSRSRSSASRSLMRRAGIRNGVAYFVVGARALGRDDRVRRAPHDRRRRTRPARDRPPADARGPRAGRHAVAPRSASSRRRSTRGSAEPERCARRLAERAAAAPLPPVDELRDRPAVRAGQRGHRAERRGRSPQALSSPITIGIVVGLVVGQARRDHGRDLAGHAPPARAVPADRRRGRRWSAPPRSPASASPSRCSSPTSRSTATSSRTPSSGSSARRSSPPRSAGSSSG